MISQLIAGVQDSFIPISLYFTFTLSPELKETISSKRTTKVSPLSRCICSAQTAKPPLSQTSPSCCLIDALLLSSLTQDRKDETTNSPNKVLIVMVDWVYMVSTIDALLAE